ncbi:MAG: radical SAM protein [Nitrospinae bacterium]|nr:radical SAM protein [Nitrospinota bacterium]
MKKYPEMLKEYLVSRIDPGSTCEGLLEFPRYFEIETVNACNARCSICAVTEWTSDTKIMKQELFEKIASEIAPHADTIKRVSLFRNGEPLLDKRLEEKIALLRAKGIKNVCLSTNVSLLNARRAEGILSAGVGVMILSIDSLEKDVYQKIRVNLDFDEVMANATRFIEMRDRMGSKASIWVRMVKQPLNAHEWPEYEKYWRALLSPGDRVFYRNLHNWGGQLQGVAPSSESYEAQLPCVALWSLMIIYANGEAPICSADIKGERSLGNVREKSIKEIWTSAQADYYRDKHAAGRKGEIDMCRDCNMWEEPGDWKESIAAKYAGERSMLFSE